MFNVSIVPNLEYKHTGNFYEGINCKKIYQYALELASNYIGEEEVLLYFPDDDEFIEFEYSKVKLGINRTVFFEWFLEPNLRNDNSIMVKDFVDKAKKGECKGRLQNLWNNPFFKDNLILLSVYNFSDFQRYFITTGFHRVINKADSSVVLQDDFSYFSVNHLKGASKSEIQKRVKMKLDLIGNNKNDIDYINCNKQFERLYEDDSYFSWYNQLSNRDELVRDFNELLDSYNKDKSSETKFPLFFH